MNPASARRLRSNAGSSSQAEGRQLLIGARPGVLGAAWARDACEETKREGRRVEGGWPGTVPEARVRVLRDLDAELMARGMRLLSSDELATATAAAYDRAKRDWLLAVRAVSSGAGRTAAASGGATRES